jgi:hypothetical protein
MESSASVGKIDTDSEVVQLASPAEADDGGGATAFAKETPGAPTKIV